MADNVTPEAVSSPASFSFATDDISTVHYPIIKLAHGALDSATIVSTSSGLPVQQQGTWTVGLGVSTSGPSKAEDVAFANGDIGVAAMAMRQDTPANTSGTDGDYEPLRVSAGRLWTSGLVTNTVTVDGSGVTQPVSHTALTELAAAIDTEVQVDVVGALPAGDNNIGNVDIVSGTITTVSALGNSTTGPQKAEDAASANGDVGIPAMAVQKATPANTAGTDGDYEMLQMSAGRLWTSTTVTGTVTVDGSGVTQPVSHAALTELAAAIDTEVQVDVVGALPAGDNNIGNVDVVTLPALAAGTNNIGDVDIASITAGDNVIGRVKLSDGTDVADILDLTNSNPLAVALVDTNGDQISSFGGGTQYTEDAAAAANPVGNAQILVRADTPAAVASTDGDNVAQRGTNYGAAYVQVVDSSGNFINTFGGSGGTASADDADFTATSTQGTPAMGVYESSPTNVTDGDMGIVGITQARRLKVDATGTVDLGATDNAVLDAIAASVAAIDTDATTIIGHVDGIEGLLTTIDADTGNVVTSVQLLDDTVTVLGTDTYTETTSKGLAIGAVRRDADTTLVGTTNEWGPLQMDANGRLKVEVFSGETLPVSGTVTANLAAGTNNIGDVDVLSVVPGTGATSLGKAEDSAHASTDTGVYVLGVRDDAPAAHSGADGDYESLHVAADGGLWVKTIPSDYELANNSKLVKKYYANTGAVTDGIVWSPAAGTRWHVTDLIINVSAAATVTFEDDKSGGDEAVMKFELAANSGVTHSFRTPWASGEDAADLLVTTSAGNVYITVTGYEI